MIVGAVSPQSPGGGANRRGSGKPEGRVAKKTASSWAVVGGGDEVAGAGEEVVGGAEDAGDGEVAGVEVVGVGAAVSAEAAGLVVVGAKVSAGIEVSGDAESKACLSLSETSRIKVSATGGSFLAGT